MLGYPCLEVFFPFEMALGGSFGPKKMGLSWLGGVRAREGLEAKFGQVLFFMEAFLDEDWFWNTSLGLRCLVWVGGWFFDIGEDLEGVLVMGST